MIAELGLLDAARTSARRERDPLVPELASAGAQVRRFVMTTIAAAVALMPACGRVRFDAHVDGSSTDGTGTDGTGTDGSSGDGPPAVSCGTLAQTCGPSGTSPCCESPMVSGGTFYRSYDVSGDGLYPSMSFPATVSAFRLDKYEVTVGRFRQFVTAGMGTRTSPPMTGAGARTLNGMANQAGWDPAWNQSLPADTTALVGALKCSMVYETWTDARADNESRPVNCLTWYEAMAFCIWDGGFLPTEAESMYAASGGNLQRAYSWSTPPAFLGIDETRASYYVDALRQCYGDGINGCASTDLVRVGDKPAGDSVFGQSDLGGNVSEWVLDWYATPYANPCNDCANLTPASYRVTRGGAFRDDAMVLRTGIRRFRSASTSAELFGVRCARAP